MPTLTSHLFCPRCNQGLPDEDWNALEMRRCPVCDASFRAVTFPALLREQHPVEPAPFGSEGDATCFYHPRKKAVIPCDNCGRFLCALCQIEFRGERWCPACLESGQRKRTNLHLETRRTNHDSIALALATLPALLIWPSLICAPMAIYVAIRYSRAPAGLLPRTRVRYYLAIGLAVAQLFAWIALLIFLIART